MKKTKASDLIDRADEREQFLNQARDLLKARTTSGGGPWPVMDIPLRLVEIESNHRTHVDQAKLAELAGLIKSRGQEIPVRVHIRTDNRVELIYGHRRLLALQMLAKSDPRFSTIRAEVLPNQEASAVQEMRAIENLHRVNLTPVEEAVAVSQLMKLLGDRQQVADRLGKSLSWVADRVYLSRLCQPVLDLVSAGFLPLGQAREIATLGDPKDQVRVAGHTIGSWEWSSQVIDQISENRTSEGHLEVLAKVARGGGARISTVEEVRKAIAERTRSLKVVGWSLDQPVGKMPPCIGCQHNTKSDPVLFTGGVTDSETEQGFCVMQSCFDGKRQLVEEAKQAALKAVEKSKGKHGKQGDKPGFIREAVAKAVPAGVKPETVERFVKTQLEKGPKATKDGNGPHQQDPRQIALRKYDDALDEWRKELVEQVLKCLFPWELLGLYLFTHSELWNKARYYMQIYQAKPPYLPPQMPVVPAAAIQQAVKQIRAINCPELAKLIESSEAEFSFYHLYSSAPNFLLELAHALGIQNGVKPMPEYADFLPKPEQSTETSTNTRGQA